MVMSMASTVPVLLRMTENMRYVGGDVDLTVAVVVSRHGRVGGIATPRDDVLAERAARWRDDPLPVEGNRRRRR